MAVESTVSSLRITFYLRCDADDFYGCYLHVNGLPLVGQKPLIRYHRRFYQISSRYSDLYYRANSLLKQRHTFPNQRRLIGC